MLFRSKWKSLTKFVAIVLFMVGAYSFVLINPVIACHEDNSCPPDSPPTAPPATVNQPPPNFLPLCGAGSGCGGGNAIPPDSNEELSIPVNPTSQLVNQNASSESMIKIQETQPVEATQPQSFFSKCADWFKEEIQSVMSVFVPNR